MKGKVYYWYVKDCFDGVGDCLHIMSPDKKFLITYQLGQAESYKIRWSDLWTAPFIVIMGKEFPGLKEEGGWRRVRTPIWENDSIITPSFARRLIEWCLDVNKQITLVDWKGYELGTR